MYLNRFDYTQVSGTSKGVLSLIPTSNRQGLVIGDQSGGLSLYSLDSSCSLIWSNQIRSISHLEVFNDKIYASTGCNVHCFSTAGKELSSFDTNVAESIKSFKVKGQDIWTAGKYIYNHYINEKEVEYLILQDTINDFLVSSVTGDMVDDVVLACNDKTIRVIHKTSTAYNCALASSPCCLGMYSRNDLMYGTGSGDVGMMKLEREQSLLLWNLQGKNSEITAVSAFDFASSGVNDVIVSRNDGNVEIYTHINNEVVLNTEFNVGENITSLVTGKPKGTPEIILSTFSGKVIGLTDSSSIPNFNLTGTLNNEISSLKQKLEDSKSQYAPKIKRDSIVASKITHKISLIGDQAAYSLAIESQFPISILIIQAEIPIELLDNEDHDAIINSTDEDSQYLISYRYSDTAHTRSQILFRNSEGQPGNLSVYIIPCFEPKIAQMLTVEIKPLSLHEKVASFSTSDRPLNTIKITGSYTKNEMHGWISQALPDVPPNTQDEVLTLYYTSCVIGSALVVTYSSGWAEFRSDSVSVLAILKESVSKNASFRKIHLKSSFVEAPDSCEYIIKLIEGHLIELQELETQFQLIEALKEIEIQGDLQKFGEEYTSILENAEKIKTQYKKYPKKLQFFQGIISDLYVDYCKFRGFLNFADRIPHLQGILANFDTEALINFFKQ